MLRPWRGRGRRPVDLGCAVPEGHAESDDVREHAGDVGLRTGRRITELFVAYALDDSRAITDAGAPRSKVIVVSSDFGPSFSDHARAVNSSPVVIDTEAPIGIFDSGFGGLTVARAVMEQLPYEDIVYLGDTARAPYGEQPIASVREYALECLDRLVDEGVKLLVIACNSGSAAVLRDARERYSVPVVEVILPAARRAVAATRRGRVGVICTQATATSLAYDDAFAAAPHLELITAACPRFVPFVEAGVTGGPELLACAEQYLARSGTPRSTL